MKFSFFLLFVWGVVPTFSYAQTDCIQTYSENDTVHISRIDLNCKNIELITSQVEDQGLTVSEFAEKY